MAEHGGLPPDDQEPPVVENLLLSVAAWWRLTLDKNTVIDLISRNFQQDNIIFALEKVKKCPGFNDLVGEVKRRNPSDNRSATSAQAKDLVELLIKMAKETKLMRFVISCEDLNRATSIMGGLGVRDERAVSARLESLELELRKLMGCCAAARSWGEG